MTEEKISSRKNPYIVHLRSLATDGGYRRQCGEYLCDGRKLLTEAVDKGAQVLSVLWRDTAGAAALPDAVRQYIAPAELFDYASPMKNSPGPVFTLKIPEAQDRGRIKNAIALENVQDPGNVGTIIRTASALGVDAVLLCGACADAYSPKTARATMGAIFRQQLIFTDIEGLAAIAEENALPLYGAALADDAEDIRSKPLGSAIVAIGSEGNGLSAELLKSCTGRIIIPMTPGSESLNAAAAAAIVMWEMSRQR